MKIEQLAIISVKSISYRGHEFTVPKDTEYMAIDQNGDLYAFESKPVILSSVWSSTDWSDPTWMGIVSDFGDWKESLEKV